MLEVQKKVHYLLSFYKTCILKVIYDRTFYKKQNYKVKPQCLLQYFSKKIIKLFPLILFFESQKHYCS